MKITALKTFVVGNPWKNWIFVKLYTDEGLTGLGEATGGLATKPNLGDIEELQRHVLGEDPRHPDRLWTKMYKSRFANGQHRHERHRTGLLGHPGQSISSSPKCSL